MECVVKCGIILATRACMVPSFAWAGMFLGCPTATLVL